MSMSIGGAKVALVEQSFTGGMQFDAFPTRLAMVLAVIDNGALSVDASYYGSDGHKAALAQVQQQIEKTLQQIAAQEKRDAYIEFVREPWIKQAAARYVERGELDQDDARKAAASLFGLIANDGDGQMPDATEAADEDISTWNAA